MKKAGNKRTIKTPIDRLEAGKSSPNFLQADHGNLVIDFINVLKKMEGRNGIKIHISESNVIIELDSNANIGGGLYDGGIWDEETAYRQGAIVRYREAVVLSTTVATMRWGTYVALQDVPAGTTPSWPEDEGEFWGMWSVGIGYERDMTVCENQTSKTLKLVAPPVY